MWKATALLCCLCAPVLPQTLSTTGSGSWQLRFHHDEDDSSFAAQGLQFVSAADGMAIGALIERGDAKPTAYVTRDGGKTWEPSKIPADPRSLFLLDKNHAWLVARNGIHFSNDFGLRWDRIAGLKNVARVAFVDPQRGFAVGAPKKVWQTEDGGRKWTEVSEAAAPKSDPDRSMYHWVHFSSPQRGTILGFHEPQRREPNFPDWMDPEGARERRQLPALVLMLETLDGGKTWKPSSSSIFGRIQRYYANANGTGLVLVEYQNGFEWPSEIYHADNRVQKMTSSFRAKNRVITDIALLPNGTAYAAGIEPSGTVARLPIPGRVVILHSADLKNWSEMKVDYRAVADRVWLAAPPGGTVWAATDTGMILQLTTQ